LFFQFFPSCSLYTELKKVALLLSVLSILSQLQPASELLARTEPFSGPAFNSFPVAAVHQVAQVFGYQQASFQFFPSCSRKGLLGKAAGVSVWDTFNSFPVAARPWASAARSRAFRFQFFPSCSRRGTLGGAL
jgi:hypothetical protein